jgi:hypothetical protein
MIRHYVMRTHSHTDKQHLWKVMSRGFKNRRSADEWKDFWEVTYKEQRKKHKFFIVSREE